MKKSVRHLTHYSILLAILLLGLTIALAVGQDQLSQMITIGAISLGYFTWGIIHHYLEKDLYLEIILEYLLFAVLGTISAIAIIFYL